jgi:replicative DNA helicase
MKIDLKDPNPAIIEYEKALIGSCLIDPRGHKIWPHLKPHDFYLEKHRVIWQAMLECCEYMDCPTVLAVVEHLRGEGFVKGGFNRLDEVGGPAGVAELVVDGMELYDPQAYGRKIRQASCERQRQAFAANLMANPRMSDQEIATALGDLEESEAELTAMPSESFKVEQDRLDSEPAVKTGIPNIDQILKRLPLGICLAVAGRTSHGKTAFGSNLGRMLTEGGVATDYLSLEERGEAIQFRWISQLTGIPLQQLRQERIADFYDLGKIAVATEKLDALPLQVLTLRSTTEDRVIAAVAASNATVIIVDHLQQVITGVDDKRNYALQRVMTRLTNIARAERKLIIVLCQLGRSADARDGAPLLSDLRDSGSIEEIARMVWLLYWPWKHKSKDEDDVERDRNEYELEIAKNNEGPTARVKLFYQPHNGRFSGGEAA